jgi:hypothetical protein
MLPWMTRCVWLEPRTDLDMTPDDERRMFGEVKVCVPLRPSSHAPATEKWKGLPCLVWGWG